MPVVPIAVVIYESTLCYPLGIAREAPTTK